jgi:tripartite-type tricarboxylate transporter receptor subunit TctC
MEEIDMASFARYISALVMLFLPFELFAQSWPIRPVKIVVPFPAGGNIDLVGRIAAERLAFSMGQPFFVENRVGAGGAIAAEFVARAPADGYTIFAAATPHLSILPLVQKVGYDPLKDFFPVVIVATNPFVLGVQNSIPARTLQEFISYAKSRPNQLNYGSAGAGTFGHLAGALFVVRAGLQMTHIPYKGGAPAVSDLVGGQIQMYFGNAAELIPNYRAGKVRLLAVSTSKRARELPDVPAVAESFANFDLSNWVGFLVASGTSRAIVERLAQEVSRMVLEPSVIEKIQKLGSDPSGVALSDFFAVLNSERAMWANAVDAAGLRMQ